ncbi:MAG: hypothetical protein JRJ69_08515 [Deltaproteobacteria bacterium]|nr:hypothetical protein [Deltaproteobacteria bacterium]MBW1910642.1 hypothetical protein [Deltaproteobacteria bacterium]MBW2034678.1 hypothetical protein [Deltaproteobacteria bacterium]
MIQALIYPTAFLIGLGIWKVSRDILYYVILVKYKDSINNKWSAALVIDFLAVVFGIAGVFAWSLFWLYEGIMGGYC